MMIFAIIFVLFFGKFLFELVTKIQILNFYSIAIPIMLASFIWQIGMFIHKPLELNLKQWQMNIAIIISLGFNLILNLIFIPIYKFEAAAFITLGSTILYVIFVFIFTKMNID
jgi:O-antigen/teichoic acid export membrane protein